MRCSYIYFMADNPDRVAAVAPEHAAYWRALALREYLGGPFADRSGGLISFESTRTTTRRSSWPMTPSSARDLWSAAG